MSSSFNRIKKNIIEAMQSTNNQGTSAYDSVAEVRRVEGDTAWVHIAGGVDETPVKLTIAAKAGDVVQVRVGGGRAWITGNASAPPTDDKTAIAAKGLANIAGNRANAAQKTADQAQIVANSAMKGAKENAAQMAQMVINFNGDIENLQDQIDGNITTWFYDADPAMNLPPVTDWDTDGEKDAHLGDIYYNTVKGYAWRFMKSGSIYSWERITDTDVTKALADAAKAQDTADSKRRVFYSTPTVPYDAGDLWVQGSGGDILRCAQAKTSTGSYDRNDWVLASKYTDNSALNTWIEGDFATTIKELEDGLVDAKIETYYQTTDPSTGWSDIQKSEHKGDLWYNSTASVQRYYRWSGTAWQELTATPPQAVFDNIDRKATIYIGTTTPTNPESGDLWFKGANEPILTYVNNSWVEYNKYTDDTAANTAKATADTAKAGVDALTTCIRQTDDGVEVARKADGNYVGYKTIQTAGGLEVRTADDVLIARYGDDIQLTNGIAEGFRVEFGNTMVQIKEKFSDIGNINDNEDNITISDDGSTWAKSYTTKWGADQATGVKASGHIYAASGSAGNFKEATMNFDLADGKSKAVKFNNGVQAAKVTIMVAYTSTGNATVTLSIVPGADFITLSNFKIAYMTSREDVCMGTLGTHPDTSTPAVFRVGNGTEEKPSNAFAVDWNGNLIAGANMYADSIALGGTNISAIFSGVISIGYEDKKLSIAAGGNTGDSTISLESKVGYDGYSARCICGWNMSGTGASNCTISKLFIHQTDQQIHYYVKNTGSSKATPTLRTYILYTKSDLPKLQ